MKKNIVALLTGRGNNTLKDKNVLPVLGRPLLYYPAMAARNSALITDFYVSSDCDKILEAAAGCGYKPIRRPEELGMPTSQHLDAILHALDEMKKDGVEPDILVVLMANSGIVKTEWIDRTIRDILEHPEISASVPVLQEQCHHPYRAKKLRNDGCLDTFFDFHGEKISTNRQDLVACYFLCHNFWTLNVRESIYSDGGQPPWTFMGRNIKPFLLQDCFDVHDEDDLLRTEKWLLKEGIAGQVRPH